MLGPTTKHIASGPSRACLGDLIEGLNSAPNEVTKHVLREHIKKVFVTAMGHLHNTGNVRYDRSDLAVQGDRVILSEGSMEDQGQGRSTFVKAFEWTINIYTGDITGGRLNND